MTVGFFSPLPPAKSGVADYSAALLPALTRAIPDVDPKPALQVSPAHYDLGLYQLGNNQLHLDIYRRALARPGIAVLHDAVLQHFFLGSLSEAEYIREFTYNYGDWSQSEAQAMWHNRSASSQDPRYFSRPLLKRIADTSRALIVHNAAAARMVRDHSPHATVIEIPLLFEPPEPVDSAAVEPFRSPFQYLFGVFGYLRESKRLITTLKAFARLQKLRPHVGLLVAGEIQSSDLARAAAPLLQNPGVMRLGHMHNHMFALASQAVDACVNLRYPSAGESSGIAIRLMGLGKPVILTAGLENAAFPAGTFLPVPSGAAEEKHLFQTMALLAEFPETGRQVGKQAAAHLFRYHAVSAVAGQYWDTLCDHLR